MNGILKNNIAVITGGSRGIGKATSVLFASEGATVIILDVNEELAERAVKEIIATEGKAKFFKTDVSKFSSVEKVGEKIFEEFGAVDILINNAGITADMSLKKMTEEQFERVINVNLKGVFNCTKVFGLHMAENGKGVIVNASSVVAHHGNFGQTNYVASKAGVIGMTKAWSKELGVKGVRVNAIAPGFVDTEMTKHIPEPVIADLKEQIPLKRFAKPEEIAGAYLFLASDNVPYINGSVLNVDGGLVLGSIALKKTQTAGAAN